MQRPQLELEPSGPSSPAAQLADTAKMNDKASKRLESMRASFLGLQVA
jgi:hypothetical protein